ncbi:hypothetical protein CXY01_36830 [Cellulomonas xylanilytica]|uniref:Uncharacterized protein n=1 Tax=Cellulomonas xylanilytica TaxID=233583 RepID=A0A510V8F7_9CELL|nr:hypothetical protein CXY01_36830 [Cellulomonas xylanilytica]
MKSAYLVSLSEAFEVDVLQAAAGLGADVRNDVAQLRDDQDRLVTVFGGLGAHDAPDWRAGLSAAPGSGPLPDLSTATAVSIECRWEDLFVSFVGRLAALLPNPSWVVDGDGVVWPAAQVDPSAVRL